MALVHSYIRFSTKKQIVGDSLRRQIEKGDEWIEKNSHTKSSLKLHDLGISAHKGKNKDSGRLGYFLTAIEKGDVKPGEILLLENLDRLSREGISEAQALFSQILKSGVQIAVLQPYEIIYTKDALNDMIGMLLPLIYFHLAYIESKNKSERIAGAWTTKRRLSKTEIIDARSPAWITYDPKKNTLSPNPGQLAVQHIFKRTAEGIGQKQLTRELQEKFPPIGRSKKWNGSYVQAILNSRTVLGERQNYVFTPEGDRVPSGDPIKGYFPRVIDDALWFRAQNKKATKKKQKGPNGNFVNLFTGLLRNAHDGFAMHAITARLPGGKVQRRLVSRGHLDSMPGSDSVSIAYKELEKVVLQWADELKVEDLETNYDAEGLRAREQERLGIERRIKELQGELSNPSSQGVPYIITALTTMTDSLKTLDNVIVKLKASMHASTPLAEAKWTVSRLRAIEGRNDPEGIRTTRLRLRTLIAELVESILIKPEKHFGRVYFRAQINYHNGKKRSVLGTHTVQIPEAEVPQSPDYRAALDEAFHLVPDLRDQDLAKNTRIFGKLASLNLPAAPVAPQGEVPSVLGPAADYWLALTRARMNPESFRIIPPKIARMVSVLGADLPLSDLTQARWELWVRDLRVQVREGTAKTTARVIYSRSRELVRWLIAVGKVGHLDGLELAAASVIG